MKIQLDTFTKPKSIAVIGATERSGAWGSFIMENLLTCKYPGKIYPVNHRSSEVCGIPSFPNINAIQGEVDLAVIAIPEEFLEETIEACGNKGFRGIVVITAGFSEAVKGGKEREQEIARLAHSHGMRILGPNVSGVYNLYANFNASGTFAKHLYRSPLAAICQGGYAINDLMVSGFSKGMGIGKFIHTGNECDLKVSDFLEYFAEDPEIKCILLHLETLRDARRFLDVARRATRKKPVIVHKTGRTAGGALAASSHTGAMAGHRAIFEGAFRQANILICPSMELLLPMGHALMERPPMRGNRVGIITMGGSWGVALTDCLEERGLKVPFLGNQLQKCLQNMGMPVRASTKNPVDIGAAGIMSFQVDTLIGMGRAILESKEVDALILHGFGRPGPIDGHESSWKGLMEMEKGVLRGFHNLEKETDLPVMLGCCLTQWESQAVGDMNDEGIRAYHRLDDLAAILSRMYQHYASRDRS